jgi:TRAP-type transport system small permease protein
MNSTEVNYGADLLSQKVHRWTCRLVQVERILAASMLCVILGTMGVQVFARYVLNHPFGWSEELSRFAMVWMALLASSFVMAEGGHIAVDVWSVRVGLRTNNRLSQFSHWIVIISCWMLILGGLKFVYFVHPVGSASLGIPKSCWYASVTVSLLLMSLHALANSVLLYRTGKPFQSPYAISFEDAVLPAGADSSNANNAARANSSPTNSEARS